ncbi:hypothetical protein EYF80_063517 [Liparis tanakae]|uniref:Uncharacterized protein n=1 Tax=Liparis tanakae TaxID=230148 RepID=A0A4Z2EC10_9TELE|nr:hypothetical protein EYF80_063517 [Liparis tanakae]
MRSVLRWNSQALDPGPAAGPPLVKVQGPAAGPPLVKVQVLDSFRTGSRTSSSQSPGTGLLQDRQQDLPLVKVQVLDSFRTGSRTSL